MADVSVAFAVGSEQVTVVLPVDLPADGETIITGDFGGLIPAGTTARLRGAVNLTDNMHVRGTLLCDPTGVDLNGNGFDIHTHDGTLNLVGVEKTAWLTWGETPVGWQVGDRLAVAPTKYGVYVPSEMTWTGSWATMVRPVNSPNVTLVNGRVALPQVVNLSQTVTLRNLQRIMIHEASGPNPQTFKWIRVLNTGEVGVLGMYPIHFHMIGEHARGSLLEGVVVEGGKNHAYVPHASHGITYLDCVAWNTTNDAYWWDPPPPKITGQPVSTINDSNDITWQHCLAGGVVQTPGSTDHRLSAFYIGAGNGNRCLDSIATGVRGDGKEISGFHWSENFVWGFVGNVAHNIRRNGIMTWTNSQARHIIDGFDAYHCGQAGIEHGAYQTQFVYRNVSLTVTNPVAGGSSDTRAILQHSNSVQMGLLFENIVTDDRLKIDHHGLPGTAWTTHRNCRYTSVVYVESGGTGPVHPSRIRYEDCDLQPADFLLNGIVPTSEIEIFEAGVLIHRWAVGAWT